MRVGPCLTGAPSTDKQECTTRTTPRQLLANRRNTPGTSLLTQTAPSAGPHLRILRAMQRSATYASTAEWNTTSVAPGRRLPRTCRQSPAADHLARHAADHAAPRPWRAQTSQPIASAPATPASPATRMLPHRPHPSDAGPGRAAMRRADAPQASASRHRHGKETPAHRPIRRQPAIVAIVVAIAIGQQAQTRRRTHFEQRKRLRQARQHRQQRGATAWLIGLRAARQHRRANVCGASSRSMARNVGQSARRAADVANCGEQQVRAGAFLRQCGEEIQRECIGRRRPSANASYSGERPCASTSANRRKRAAMLFAHLHPSTRAHMLRHCRHEAKFSAWSSHARSPSCMRQCAALRRRFGSLALVPTMGALHDGHRALVRAALASGAAVVVSIFVNPLQFDASEDLSRYPRDEAGDLARCRPAAAISVWLPDVATMYPAG